MIVFGQVGNKSHGHPNIDASSDCDGQHSQEECSPRAGACMVEVALGYSFVCLQDTQQQKCNIFICFI